MRSIIQTNRHYCYLCGRVRSFVNPLEEHHVYFGPNRKISEKYGLKVYLCKTRCHNGGPYSVHKNAENCKVLQSEVQQIAMKYYGWSIKDFIRIIGRNYTEDMP